jgi:hypothetical protein
MSRAGTDIRGWVDSVGILQEYGLGNSYGSQGKLSSIEIRQISRNGSQRVRDNFAARLPCYAVDMPYSKSGP